VGSSRKPQHADPPERSTRELDSALTESRRLIGEMENLLLEARDLVLAQLEPRQMRHVQQLFAINRHLRSILPKRKGPLPGPSQPWSDEVL